MEPILTIDNLNSFGGNMLRQGDKSQLKYRLRDVGGKNLGISSKSCEIKMYGRNYTTVVYETTATVSSDNTVSFTIDKVLPKGTFYLEFTVGDYIFPTDHREFFEITPSGKGMEANIIEIVGVDAVANKVIERIGNNIGEVVNAEEVAGAIERDNLLDGKVIPKDESVTNKKLASGATTLSKIDIDGYLPKTLEHKTEGGYIRRYSVAYLQVGDIIKLNGDFQVSITKINEPDDSYADGSEGRRVWSYDDWTVPEESWYYIRVRFESNASITGDDVDNLTNRGVLILTSDTAVTKKELNEALSDLPTEGVTQKLSQSGDVITLSGDGGTIDLSNKQDKLTDGDITTPLISDKSVTLSKLDIDGYLPVPFEVHLRGNPPYDDSVPANSRASAHFDVIEKGWTINVLNDDISISIFEYSESFGDYVSQFSWTKSHTTQKEYSNAVIVFKKDSGLVFTKEELSQFPNWVEIVTEDTAVKRKEFLPLKEKVDNMSDSGNTDTPQFSISELGRKNENIIFNGLATESVSDTAGYSDTYIYSNSLLNTEIVDKQIVIKPGGYWFIRLNPEAFMNESKLVVRFNMLQGYQPGKHSVRLIDADGRNTYTYIQSTDTELSIDLPEDIEAYQRIEIRFDNRTGTEDLILDYVIANTYDNVNPINLGMSLVKTSGGGGLGTKYVSLTGSNTNSGDSMDNGYATLQKALQELNGIGTIIIERGIYYGQSVNYKAKDIKILAHTEPYDGSIPDRQLAEFRGSDILSGWVANSGVYRIPYSGNTRFDSVFVSKTLPPETTNSRPSYNAVLWEGNDGVSDYKMKPVLTLAECQSEIGTFFYDGSYLYINPKDVSKEFNAVKTDTGFNLSGDNVTLQDIVFDFYTGVPMRLFKIKNLVGQNCGASHSSTGNGFGFDYTNATMTNCLAHKNRNDGFNMHFYGDTTLINCKGLNNYDDGVSHHEDCTGTIVGGEYSGNVKGGIIPVNGSTIQVYGAVIENNRFGFYTESPNALSHGNFYKDNEEAIVNLADTPIRSINDVFVNNPNREGNLTLYGETIL